ncbi:MAG: L-rhamnose mutarotase [Prolixibacteraceae bacterium]
MEKTLDYVFTCNLLNNAEVIKRYKTYHNSEMVWPEVTKTFVASGAKSIKIYIQHTRLVLIITLPESVSFDEFSRVYSTYSDKINDWDKLMASFQVPPPGAKGPSWEAMEELYRFEMNH